MAAQRQEVLSHRAGGEYIPCQLAIATYCSISSSTEPLQVLLVLAEFGKARPCRSLPDAYFASNCIFQAFP